MRLARVRRGRWLACGLSGILLLAPLAPALAQGKTEPKPAQTRKAAPAPELWPPPDNPPGPAPRVAGPPVAPVRGPRAPAPPQVLTVVHRLEEAKFWFMLQQRGGDFPPFDASTFPQPEIHINIVAGFSLDGGPQVVAQLPHVDAEPLVLWGDQAANIKIARPGGRSLAAKVIGLDAKTRLTLLSVDGLKLPPAHDAPEGELAEGAAVRLYAPTPVPEGEGTGHVVSVRMEKIEGRVSKIIRSANGKLEQIRIATPRVSPMIAGAVATDVEGGIIGVVADSSHQEAHVLPISAVRRTVERLRVVPAPRQFFLAKPWLGVRGLSVAALKAERLVSRGWDPELARTYVEQREGIFLISVPPGTPAAAAGLRSGDIITRAGGRNIATMDDFSAVLEEYGAGKTIPFTIARPHTGALPVSVRLGESLNPSGATREVEAAAKRGLLLGYLIALGIEALPVPGPAAKRLGKEAGLNVVFVRPESPAARAGLRAGDVIESINGQPLNGPESFQSVIPAHAAQLEIIYLRADRKQAVSLSLRGFDDSPHAPRP